MTAPRFPDFVFFQHIPVPRGDTVKIQLFKQEESPGDQEVLVAAQPERNPRRKRKKTISFKGLQGPCKVCGVAIDAQWRGGPAHFPVLCNLHGLRFRHYKRLFPDYVAQWNPEITRAELQAMKETQLNMKISNFINRVV